MHVSQPRLQACMNLEGVRNHMIEETNELKRDVQVELFKSTMARKAAQFLEGQMIEKAARDTQIAALYTNEPKPEYFMQFGTSHR